MLYEIVAYFYIVDTVSPAGMRPDTAMNFGLLLLFYGLYFGVVSRDFSETCTEMMAASIGVRQNSVPTNLHSLALGAGIY